MADNADSGVEYLLSLQAVRARANRVYDLALDNRLNHFHFDKERLNEASAFVAQVISVSREINGRFKTAALTSTPNSATMDLIDTMRSHPTADGSTSTSAEGIESRPLFRK